MGKQGYFYKFREEAYTQGARASFDIPNQYQAATLYYELKGRITKTGAGNSVLRPGGLLNLMREISLEVSGIEDMITMPATLAAALMCARRRQNIDDIVTIKFTPAGGNAPTATYDGSLRTITAAGVYDFTIMLPLDFQHVGGIRPADTLFNLYMPGATFYAVAKPPDSFTAGAFSAGAADVAFSNTTMAIWGDQKANLTAGKNPPLIDTIGQFRRQFQTTKTDAAQQGYEYRLPWAPMYSAGWLMLIDAVNLTPVYERDANGNVAGDIADIVNEVTVAIESTNYRIVNPRQLRKQASRQFGEFVNSSYYPSIIPIIFTRNDGNSPDSLRDAMVTIQTDDFKFRVNYEASAGNLLALGFEKFMPNTAAFINQIYGREIAVDSGNSVVAAR